MVPTQAIFSIDFTCKMTSRFSQNLYSEAISKLRFGDSTTAPFRRYVSLFCCLTLAEGCYYSKLLRSLAKPFLAFAWPRKDCMASQSIAFPRKTFARKRKDCEVMQYLCVPSQTFAWPRNRKNIFLMSCNSHNGLLRLHCCDFCFQACWCGHRSDFH